MNFDNYPLDAQTCQFQVGSCKYLHSFISLTFPVIFADYETYETVTCNSHFIYDLDRQRSLQHFIQIEGLPAKYKVLKLPSGNCLHSVKSFSQVTQLLFFLRNLRSVWHSSEIPEETNAVHCSSNNCLQKLTLVSLFFCPALFFIVSWVIKKTRCLTTTVRSKLILL